VKKITPIALIIFLGILLATGCKPHYSGYFHTSYQDESQYIVETIVSDLAEQMYYAANHRLPDPKTFEVTATEKPGASPLDAPVYELEIHLDPKPGIIKTEVNINGPIWSPAVYQSLATELAQAFGLTAGEPASLPDTSLLSTLSDNSAETIQDQNEQLSESLEQDFKNPQLHEQAAALLGAFLLRDHSGYFFEIRAPLSRMTAHLAMAQFFNGNNSLGVNGQMAEAMLFTLIGDQSLALDQLKAIGTSDTTILPMVRALQTRITGDYRVLGQMNNLTPIESIEWFLALSDYVSCPLAWEKLSDDQQHTIDFVRAANSESYSVEMGHQLSSEGVTLELKEIESVYKLTHHEALTKKNFLKALNEMPERCFTTGPDGKVHVCVIGWGQWADFLQRHLCHAVQQGFYFLQDMYGSPDDAKEFAGACDQQFSGLRLYPFVERFDCTDVDSYHKSVDDGFKVTVATPQLTPANCWNWLCYSVDFAPLYSPNSNPHVNEWHAHNPPPGTVYDLNPRLNHPSLTDRGDAVARFETFHQWAPYDCRVINFILKKKYPKGPDYDQAMALYQNVAPYSIYAMRMLARTAYNEPQQYQKLMLQAAQVDPTCYYDLGNYEADRQEDDQAAQYYDKASETDPDSVRVSYIAVWRVRYYLKKGDIAMAQQIADYAGQQVGSYRGLEAEGIFYETTSNYDSAFQWYESIEESYRDSSPLLDFCLRYKALTGDTRFDSEVKKRVAKLFPQGMEKVSLGDFRAPPTDGVLIAEENSTVTYYGLKAGDVIVALGGTRTRTFEQYAYLRNSQTSPELDLIVWQGNGYHEISASPPNRRFGVNFGDYKPQ
jgi:tetratricopeptide (TPR) repeat protein